MASSSTRDAGPGEEGLVLPKQQKRRQKKTTAIVLSHNIDNYRGDQDIEDLVKFINGVDNNAKGNRKKEVQETPRSTGTKSKKGKAKSAPSAAKQAKQKQDAAQ